MRSRRKRFKDVKVGETFRFLSEVTMRFSGMKTGPWTKISKGKYKHCDDGMVCTVGTINVAVCN
jgi:hypothetical protein